METTVKKMTTTVQKGFHGWVAETEIDLAPVKSSSGKDGTRVLQITTMKRHSGQITTSFSGSIRVENEGCGFVSHETIIFEEYNKFLVSDQSRATEKSVKTAHENALKLAGAHVELAKTFYNIGG